MRRIRRQELPPTPVFFHAAQRSIRVNVEAAVIAPLSRHLGLTLGSVVRFHNLPEPGVKKTDRFLTSGVQLTFEGPGTELQGD